MPHTPLSHPCVERQGDTPGVVSGKALPLKQQTPPHVVAIADSRGPR
jgi:hypothetical protein